MGGYLCKPKHLSRWSYGWLRMVGTKNREQIIVDLVKDLHYLACLCLCMVGHTWVLKAHEPQKDKKKQKNLNSLKLNCLHVDSSSLWTFGGDIT